MMVKGFSYLNDRGLSQLCASFGMTLSAGGDMITGTTRQLRALADYLATIEKADWIRADLVRQWEAKYSMPDCPAEGQK